MKELNPIANVFDSEILLASFVGLDAEIFHSTEEASGSQDSEGVLRRDEC